MSDESEPTDESEPEDPTPDEPLHTEQGDRQPQPEATPVPGAFAGAVVTFSYDATGVLHLQAGPLPQFAQLYPHGPVVTYTYDSYGNPVDPPTPLP